MAELYARISRPPTRARVRRIGSSQNFFRWRINAQSSTRIDTRFLKLLGQAGRIGAGWIAGHPVGCCGWIAPQEQRIAAGEPEKQRKGGEDQMKE